MSGLPEGMANGHCRSADSPIWERPWTLEEMRQNGANWSLAADSGLFLFLQDFSQRMLSKTHEIEKQLDSLIRDTKATDSCLHSVFNDFLMLSNTQFIENRVYDEEVEETLPKSEALEKLHEQEKTREQKEAELIPKMQEAVRYGLGVLESAFEHLDIKAGNSDSEDEEVMDRVEPILEPKDLYVDRPLPYLIGSQAFMEHEDVGLGDLSSDEMSVDSDRDSVIESEDGRETDQSDEDYEKEDAAIHIKKSSTLSYDAEEDDEDSDIFGESDKDDDDDDDLKATGPSSFADELAARIKGEPINKPEGDRASFSSKKKNKGRKENKAANAQGTEDDSDDMFKPPKMDEDEFSPFGGKGGLFSGGRGLFSDDDDGDLFSEAPKSPKTEETKTPQESTRHANQATETKKPGKKIPAGAVSIFPENSLFSSGNDSDTEGAKEREPPALKTNTTPKPGLLGAGTASGGGGLFDDDDEDDDFFSGKNLKKSNTAEHEKPKHPKPIDLFDDDEDGDIFGNRAVTPSQSTTEPVVEQSKPPEKKMPAGAISLFGPGTKSLLSEGLKKRQQSTSEEPGRSEENSSTPDVGPGSSKQKPKVETRGLFSDDEDTQVFPTITKSKSNPESSSHSKTNKAPLSLFDDEEEEDLFAYAAKTKPTPSQAKVSTQQPSKATSSSLFSDDEDQWTSSKSSSTKTESKAGGMKSSASAPTSLLSTKTTAKSSLFDEEDDDDLFASSNTSSQKKPQRVALLFEDENDEDHGSLFGTTPANNASPVGTVKTQDVSSVPKEASPPNSKDMLSKSENAPVRAPKVSPTPPLTESSESKKKPAGAVSLFGGIDVFANKRTKSPLEDAGDDDLFLPKDSPPVLSKKEEKPKTTSVSLFDDDGGDEEDEPDTSTRIFAPSESTTAKTLKPTEERPQTKSTGVFQDEELLFSHTQQKDNDPDFDLFATSGKAASSKPNLVKPAAQSLFVDEDEDDLFGPPKQRVPPLKAPEKLNKATDRAPLSTPDPISENQASLMINPAALLPGAAASLPGAVPTVGPSSSSGVSSASLSPSPVISPTSAQPDSEGGVSFDVPVQVSTLQSAQKGRAKGSAHRRPQSRAARQQAVQTLVEDNKETIGGDSPAPNPSLFGIAPANKSDILQVDKPLANSSAPSALSTSSNSQPSHSKISPRPSDLTLPVSTNAEKKDSKVNSTKVLPSPDEEDLFASDGLFGATSVTNTPTQEQTTAKSHLQASSVVAVKKENGKSTLSSIFDDDADDLFQKVKQRPNPKAAKVSNFLEEQDDEEDIFGLSNSSTPTSAKETQNSSRISKNDIFQDEVTTVPKVHEKHKEKTLNASLFSENIDIFADLSDTLKPKQSKSKTKGETKSIFDDDMDDIFSSSTVRAAPTAPRKSKKPPPAQDTARTTEPSSIFDDPLNALGGN